MAMSASGWGWEESVHLSELGRLGERAVARDVPGREAHPLRARGDLDLEALPAERRARGGGHDLGVGTTSVAPDRLDEVERKGPLDVGNHDPPSGPLRDFVRGD